MNRNRLYYGILLVGIMAAGLATRRYGNYLPVVIAVYGGDTLWALMIFVGFGLLARSWPTRRVSGLALLVCYGVELSQLYRAAWIDRLRENPVGGLVLGRGFLWSDLICYTIGVSLGVAMEYFWQRQCRQTPAQDVLPAPGTKTGLDKTS